MWVKRAQNGTKIKFFGFLKNSKFCYRYFTTNLMSCRILVLELWVKMLLANQTAGSLKCNIPKKKRMMKFNFGMQIDIKVFYKLILSSWVCVAIHTQSTQNKKFIYIYIYIYLCNILRKTYFVRIASGCVLISL